MKLGQRAMIAAKVRVLDKNYPTNRRVAELVNVSHGYVNQAAVVISAILGTIALTFEDYCRERWKMVASRARQLIGAAQIVGNLQSVTNVTPTHESQVRPLAGLEPDEQREAWKAATASDP